MQIDLDINCDKMKEIQTKYGRCKINKGHWRVTSSKEGNHGKYLHRLIYEDYHNITLLPTADVHHKDGDKLNNNINNLELKTHSKHSKDHNIGKKHSEETKEKLKQIKLGKKDSLKTKFKKSIGILLNSKNNGKLSKAGGIGFIETNVKKGLKAAEIGDIIGVNEAYILDYVRKMGIGIREIKNGSYYEVKLDDFVGETCLCLFTKGCDNSCLYCFNKFNKNAKPLHLNVAKYLIDKHKKYISAISLTSGEPLKNFMTVCILKYAKEKGLKTKIDTSLETDIWISKKIFEYIDLANISIKNYEYLISHMDIIKWFTSNTNCEFNLVYHPDFFDKKELQKINNVLTENFPTVPLKLVQMQMLNFKDKTECDRAELIKISKIFPDREIYIETKELGVEKI